VPSREKDSSSRATANVNRVELIAPGSVQHRRAQRRLPGIAGPAFTQTMRADSSGLKLLRSSLSAPSHTEASGQSWSGRIEAITKAARALSAERSQGFADFAISTQTVDLAWPPGSLLGPEKVEEALPSPSNTRDETILRLPKVPKAQQASEARVPLPSPAFGQQGPPAGFPPPGWRKANRSTQLATHGRTIMA
jgi:hypothetical protein